MLWEEEEAGRVTRRAGGLHGGKRQAEAPCTPAMCQHSMYMAMITYMHELCTRP